ncbi:hypothetical protein [Conexibacter arvalis]|uniref:Uncharacterized protein n=1 Tax=Conexibacter arvalis TaxID=912552 RepID=A0A840I9H4_9ACTN|nr:hypothetical protein [Conexibacter arvalis]MBB4661232.1 hypothetical protein [Conexibacter arvalis]
MSTGQGRTIAATAGMLLGLAAAAAAPTAIAAPKPAKPAIAVGRSADGKASFRLEGRRLIVTLRQPFARRRAGTRPHVTAICGEALDGAPASRYRRFRDVFLLDPARRAFTVSPRVRRLRLQLDRDIAARANWCGVRSSVRGGRRFLWARTTLRRGSRPGCVATARSPVESERAIAEYVYGWKNGAGSVGDYALRACLRPDGPWRVLTRGVWTKYGSTGPWGAVLSGSRIVWAVGPTGDGCSIWRTDLAGGAPERLASSPDPTLADACPREHGLAMNGNQGVLVLGEAGGLAWIVRGYGEPVLDQLNVADSDGSTVTLASAPAESISDIAISADGLTVTWREHGIGRSAPMP